jgi:hypothetical protein
MTSMSGHGIYSSSANIENVPENQAKVHINSKDYESRPKLTNITTPNSEFAVLSNIEFKEIKKDDPIRGIFSYLIV